MGVIPDIPFRGHRQNRQPLARTEHGLVTTHTAQSHIPPVCRKWNVYEIKIAIQLKSEIGYTFDIKERKIDKGIHLKVMKVQRRM